MSTIKEDLVAELERRVEDKIMEPTNAALLKKLISNAEASSESGGAAASTAAGAA